MKKLLTILAISGSLIATHPIQSMDYAQHRKIKGLAAIAVCIGVGAYFLYRAYQNQVITKVDEFTPNESDAYKPVSASTPFTSELFTSLRGNFDKEFALHEVVINNALPGTISVRSERSPNINIKVTKKGPRHLLANIKIKGEAERLYNHEAQLPCIQWSLRSQIAAKDSFSVSDRHKYKATQVDYEITVPDRSAKNKSVFNKLVLDNPEGGIHLIDKDTFGIDVQVAPNSLNNVR